MRRYSNLMAWRRAEPLRLMAFRRVSFGHNMLFTASCAKHTGPQSTERRGSARRRLLTSLLLAIWGVSFTMPCRADRIVLGPDGLTLPPRGLRAEFAATPYRTEQNLSWLQVALPMGLEIQTQFLDIANDKRTLYSLDAQYPFLTEFGLIPAVSFGVRDLLGTGTEHRSFYVAASKTLPLSEGQLKIAHDFRITLGVGTERMDGLFVGFHSRLKAGLFVDAEIYRRRPNISLALPLVRNLQARAYSLDGNVFYGLSYTLAR